MELKIRMQWKYCQNQVTLITSISAATSFSHQEGKPTKSRLVFNSPPARWGLPDFIRAVCFSSSSFSSSSSSPILFAKCLANLHCQVCRQSSSPSFSSILFASSGSQCAAGPHPPGSDRRVHRWRSSATVRAQCAPLTSSARVWSRVHRWTSSSKVWSQCAQLDLNRQTESRYMPKEKICHDICQIECQNICQIECQNICRTECHGGNHTKQSNLFFKGEQLNVKVANLRRTLVFSIFCGG